MENFMENEIIENSDEMDTEAEDQEITDVDEIDPDDIDAEAEVEVNPISELIGSIEKKDFVAAGATFNDILAQRMQVALDGEKVALADTLYNETPQDTTDEISDEDIEDTEEDITAEQEEESVAAA